MVWYGTVRYGTVRYKEEGETGCESRVANSYGLYGMVCTVVCHVKRGGRADRTDG